MNDLVCADVRQWLQQAVLPKDLLPLDPALCAHIETCPLCRGALAVLAVEALDLPAAPGEIDCRRCEEDLAAFIEQEAEEGSAAAIRTYPQVWWHLWACEVCAETYRITRSLLAERPGASVVPSMPATLFGQARPRQPVLKLPRSFLHRSLAGSIPATGTARGIAGFRNVLAEEESADQHLILSVQRQADGEWRVDVSVKPPPVGWLVLMTGATHFRARFDDQGEAVVQDVPFALLTAPDGPDLDVDIELDTEHDRD